MPRLRALDRPALRRDAGPAAWWAAATLVVSLTTIHWLMRDHKPGLAAEPANQEPGPKAIDETDAL